MKNTLLKTRELWKELNESEDYLALYVERREIEKEIEIKENQQDKVDSMDEYRLLTQEIEVLQGKLKEKEIEIRLQPKKEERVFLDLTPKVKDTYNQEFKPYHDKYLKLDEKLKKQLRKFAEETEPIVKEMLEIEYLEQSFHSLKIKKGVSPLDEFIKLPIDKRGLSKETPWRESRDYNLSENVQTVIKAINRIK